MASSTPKLTATTGPPQEPEPIVIVAYVCFGIGGLLILGGLIRLLVWACSSPSEEKSRVRFYSKHSNGNGFISRPEMTEARKRGSVDGHGSYGNYTFSKPVELSDEINGGSETSRTESQVHDVTNDERTGGDGDAIGTGSHSPARSVHNRGADLVDILVHQLKQDKSQQQARNVPHISPANNENLTDTERAAYPSHPDGNGQNETKAMPKSDQLAEDKYMTLRNARVNASDGKDRHYVSKVHMIVSNQNYVRVLGDDSPESDTIYINPTETQGEFTHYSEQLDHDISSEYEDNKRQLSSGVLKLPMHTSQRVSLI